MKKLSSYSFLFIAPATTPVMMGTGKGQVIPTIKSIPVRSYCGSTDSNRMRCLVGGDGYTASVELLAPQIKAWQYRAMAPVIMHHLMAQPNNGKIYVPGAFSLGAWTRSLFKKQLLNQKFKYGKRK